MIVWHKHINRWIPLNPNKQQVKFLRLRNISKEVLSPSLWAPSSGSLAKRPQTIRRFSRWSILWNSLPGWHIIVARCGGRIVFSMISLLWLGFSPINIFTQNWPYLPWQGWEISESSEQLRSQEKKTKLFLTNFMDAGNCGHRPKGNRTQCGFSLNSKNANRNCSRSIKVWHFREFHGGNDLKMYGAC